ncbi:hypothetical protein [Streptomyces sp. CC208A]|uniref:hypothetical protein n=1 Tax=Streptomyces sp. CC208A TaxID=3044573 RepID=UPI0024A896A2|nr:hypothetical protein [Streptomyces sp. CC208A]
MTRVPLTIDRLVATPTGTERYLAADIAITLGTSLDKLPGLQLTARRDRHSRLYNWTPGTTETR